MRGISSLAEDLIASQKGVCAPWSSANCNQYCHWCQ